MIEIIKILEGGIDLRTGSEEPRSLVLSHNGSIATMPIADEQLAIILQLLGAGEHPQVRQALPPSAPAPSMPTIPSENGHNPSIQEEMPAEDGYDDPETGVAAF